MNSRLLSTACMSRVPLWAPRAPHLPGWLWGQPHTIFPESGAGLASVASLHHTERKTTVSMTLVTSRAGESISGLAQDSQALCRTSLAARPCRQALTPCNHVRGRKTRARDSCTTRGEQGPMIRREQLTYSGQTQSKGTDVLDDVCFPSTTILFLQRN